MAKTRNGKKRGKMGAVKRGRPRLDGPREPNGRPQRGRYAGSGRSERAVGATPEQRLRQIAVAFMTAGLPDASGRKRGGTDLTSCPLDLLYGAGLVSDEAYRVMMKWRELHRRIVGAPAPASREKAGTVAEVTPEMQRQWRFLTEAMSARERAAVFAIAVEECWPAWIMAADGWGHEDAITSADGKRCHLFRNGMAAMVEAEAKPLQSVIRRQQRCLTESPRIGNVTNGASISGPETDHHDADTPDTATTRQARR